MIRAIQGDSRSSDYRSYRATGGGNRDTMFLVPRVRIPREDRMENKMDKTMDTGSIQGSVSSMV